MFSFKLKNRIRNRKALTMVTVLVLVMLSAIGLIMMAQTERDHLTLNGRRRAVWDAFMFAEAGIAQIQHWALNPGSYTPDTSLFSSTNTGTSLQERYPDLYAAVQSGGFSINDNTIQSMNILNFTTSYGETLGRCTEIMILPPDAGDPVACEFKIIATGTATRGMQREVLAYANLNPLNTIDFALPAALISFDQAAFSGNVKVHWGEVWARNDLEMASENQYSYLATDPDAIWRTMGQINDWGGGWRVDTASNPDVLTSLNNMGQISPYTDTFYQNQAEADFPAPWPEFDYQTFKDMALSNGRYYSTDAAGNVYRDGIIDAAHQVDFLTEFGQGNQNDGIYDLVFIDTIDKQPPAADGSNLPTIQVSGNSAGLKGIFYVCANFDVSGIGSPPALNVNNPYSGASQNLTQIWLNGAMVVEGYYDSSGNCGVYGSIVTKGGYVGTGTPDVYYNKDLADGIPLNNGNAGSPFRITQQSNYGV